MKKNFFSTLAIFTLLIALALTAIAQTTTNIPNDGKSAVSAIGYGVTGTDLYRLDDNELKLVARRASGGRLGADPSGVIADDRMANSHAILTATRQYTTVEAATAKLEQHKTINFYVLGSATGGFGDQFTVNLLDASGEHIATAASGERTNHGLQIGSIHPDVRLYADNIFEPGSERKTGETIGFAHYGGAYGIRTFLLSAVLDAVEDSPLKQCARIQVRITRMGTDGSMSVLIRELVATRENVPNQGRKALNSDATGIYMTGRVCNAPIPYVGTSKATWRGPAAWIGAKPSNMVFYRYNGRMAWTNQVSYILQRGVAANATDDEKFNANIVAWQMSLGPGWTMNAILDSSFAAQNSYFAAQGWNEMVDGYRFASNSKLRELYELMQSLCNSSDEASRGAMTELCGEFYDYQK